MVGVAMTSKQMVRDKLSEYERKELFGRNTGVKLLVKNFMSKARHNLGNRTLYIYIDIPVNKGLSSGVTYNVSPSSPWQLFAS